MKIVIITPYWKNSEGGGIKTYLVNLVNALKNKGVDVNVIFRKGNDNEQFNGGKNKILFPYTCFQQLRKIHPDMIYSQDTWYCLFPGVIYKMFYECRLVHTFRSEPEQKLPHIFRFFFQCLLNRCDCICLTMQHINHMSKPDL